MGLVIFNALLYVVALFVYWLRHKQFNYYILVLLIYTATAFLCAYNYSLTPYKWNDLKIFPFIYLFMVLMIFLYPLRNFNNQKINISVIDGKYIRYLAYFYVVFAFANVVTSFEHAIYLLQSGEWADIYNEYRNNKDSFELYENSFERFIINVVSYLSPFAYVYTFYILTKPKFKKIFFVIMLMAIVLPSFIAAMNISSRGMVVFLTLKLLISYLLFSNNIPKQRKKIIYIIAVFLLIMVLTYTLAVTNSRFGDESTNSLIDYFGHSMLSFNDGIFNNMHQYAWGKRFFKWFIDLFGGNSAFDLANAGATHGTAFFTFVGGMFIDWGIIGTVIVAFIASNIIKKYSCKKKLLLSDTVMIVFYVDFLANGIYAYNSGRALLWIMTYVVCIIVKKLEYGYSK